MPARYAPYSQPSPEIISLVLARLSCHHPLSDGLKQAFIDLTFNVHLKKGEHLVKEGEHSHYLYFLISGVVTGYRLNGHKRLITFICVSGDFVAAIEGMYGITPADEYMVAEEDCQLVAIRSEHLLHFFDTFMEMNIIMRKILENYYKDAHERAVISRMGTAKDKYAYYLRALPNHQDKVSIELAANFLDMKPQTLLKIKKSHQTPYGMGTAHVYALAEAMTKDKLYQEKKICLKNVATYLRLSPHYLSYLLNDHYQQNFTDFINTYRINFVKERLKSKVNFQQTTIEALGDQAGFSSKSTFFSVFKKQTGLSPLAYAKKLSTLET